MTEPQRVREFFEAAGLGRDRALDEHAVLQYEQARRQALLLRLLQPAAGDRLLDVGCGNGRDLRVYAACGARAVGVDFTTNMLREARRALDARGLLSATALLQADATQLPFVEGAFDKVACSEVIEHVQMAAALVAEMYRVLRPGGLAVLTTPNRFSLYGAYRAIEKGWTSVRHRGASSSHPYDDWKTSREVITLMREAGFTCLDLFQACYVPSHAAYRLPVPLQRLVVRAAGRFESRFAHRLRRLGYTIGVAARKP